MRLNEEQYKKLLQENPHLREISRIEGERPKGSALGVSYKNKDNKETKKRKNKFGNKKVINEFGTFDSKLEYEHFLFLKVFLERKPYYFKRQEYLPILEGYETINWINGDSKNIRSISYVADFTIYNKDNELILIIDSKGVETPEFKLKRKFIDYIYFPIPFLVINDGFKIKEIEDFL